MGKLAAWEKPNNGQSKLFKTEEDETQLVSNANTYLALHGDNANWFPFLDDILERKFGKKAQLVYLDPPYNTRRYRGARRNFKDRNPRWKETVEVVIRKAHECLADTGFLAISINGMELFNLKNIADEFFPEGCFVGLFPIKVRHFLRQLMINATYHDVYEYLLIFRKNHKTRFNSKFVQPRLDEFKYQIETFGIPERRVLGGKEVEIFAPKQYQIKHAKPSQNTFRRYIIAGKVATANWSGEFYENHLKKLGKDLLIKVHGLEKQGLGYRWFLTGNHDRQSGVYFQSTRTAGRLELFSNHIDYTEVVPTIYKEGGPGCDFKDSKKPEALLNLLMDMTTKEGELVLDFYGGSGTTLAVAIKKKRSCLIIEKNEFALQVMRNRLHNLQHGNDLDGKVYKFKYTTLCTPEEWLTTEQGSPIAEKVLSKGP